MKSSQKIKKKTTKTRTAKSKVKRKPKRIPKSQLLLNQKSHKIKRTIVRQKKEKLQLQKIRFPKRIQKALNHIMKKERKEMMMTTKRKAKMM